eukprot:gnl/MRDRNA2_/MRDRNA2_94568_c0_seq1.p1 gnl/MRDRNA2_/MRDRNA2_94568_c0~~gnl/MRDRNA2_/MRDRNA2_94568_c0_seq1.p1  ORF type:complete len:449 (+),score=97.21 gnl/MRDRNA2_/MRDRNA2_94568_c0_seq1:72-1418(+)
MTAVMNETMIIRPPPKQVDARRSYPRRGAHAMKETQERELDIAPAQTVQAPQLMYQPGAHTQRYGLEISVRNAAPPPTSDAQRRLLANVDQGPTESTTAIIDALQAAIIEGELGRAKWEELEETARGALHGMNLAQMIKCLRCFHLSGHQDVERLLPKIATQAAPLLREASSGQLVTFLHWMSRTGLRDPSVINLCGNEMLLRTTHDFVTEMFVEVLNAHALLDVRHPQLTQECVRELVPVFPDFSKEQCAQVAPLTVLTVMPDSARMVYLNRCAELQMALPATAFKEGVVHQYRLLQLALEAEHRPAQLPSKVSEWLDRIRRDAEMSQKARPRPTLTRTEKDVYRVLEQVMGLQTTPSKQQGIFTLHLAVEGGSKHCFEVLKRDNFFVSPSPTTHAIRPETKLRHKLLLRQGWRPVVIRESEWWEWLDDEERSANLQQAMENHRNRS